MEQWWNTGVFQGVFWDTAIHGEHVLPQGYRLVVVPHLAPIEFITSAGDQQIKSSRIISSSYNVLKLLLSFAQAIWAIVTLYQARGDQISRYGYAAFGLTVAPYAFMSILNIIGSLVTPVYPTMFMIRTPVMDEAEAQGRFFLDELRVRILEDLPSNKYAFRKFSYSWAGLLFGLIPLGIVGALSGFHQNDSTFIQRGLTMIWLVLGIVAGIWFKPRDTRNFNLGARIFRGVFFSAGPIGGMIVVGLMIQEYGICTLLT